MFESFKLSRFKRQVKSWIVTNLKSFPINWLSLLDENELDTFFKCLVNNVTNQLANENNVVVGDDTDIGNVLGVVTEYSYHMISNQTYGYLFTYLINIFNDYHKEV
jgi:hypothetical protein|nr:MAG TPA: hypothetical protein [Caudoviricetes sp.]